MKSIPSFLFVLAVMLMAVGCYESKPAPKYPIDGAVDMKQAPAPASGGASGVKHYICSNNCAGSGGDAAGNCPVCGNAYVHNDAYHNTNNAAPNPAAQPTPTTTQTTESQITFTDPNSTEPAQNADGVWHYICSAGCAGGAGTAGNCATCGGALAHNADYHK
ncbi:MAG: hypothetical protein AAF960_30255 [Bacteroidota bacterium]